jgi:hypothetical protein
MARKSSSQAAELMVAFSHGQKNWWWRSVMAGRIGGGVQSSSRIGGGVQSWPEELVVAFSQAAELVVAFSHCQEIKQSHHNGRTPYGSLFHTGVR